MVIPMTLSELHEYANGLITSRGQTHGDLEDTFRDMAARMSLTLGMQVSPSQAARLMVDMKMARWDSGGYNLDHAVDGANYLLISAALELNKI
jgi:hypothetical protein